MRKYIDIINEAFGQRNAAAFTATERQPPTYLHLDVMHGREFNTAQAYADHNNNIHVTSYDPPALIQRHERLQLELMATWNSWVKAGYIVPKQAESMEKVVPSQPTQEPIE